MADLRLAIVRRMAESLSEVWTRSDFWDLDVPESVNQALDGLVAISVVRRLPGGLFDIPHVDIITGERVAVDYAAVVDAIDRLEGREEQI